MVFFQMAVAHPPQKPQSSSEVQTDPMDDSAMVALRTQNAQLDAELIDLRVSMLL